MSKARSFASAACALVVATLLAAFFAAGGGADGTVTNPKHIFWAPGQSPTGTVASITNDIIYHGGNAGPGAIGIQKTPAVYLILGHRVGQRLHHGRHERQALLEQDASELSE